MAHARTTMLPRAEELVDLFRPHCDRIEIGGSIRRGKVTVKDIEIVAVPKVDLDLFGNQIPDRPSAIDDLIDKMIAEGKVTPRCRESGQKIAMGLRFKALIYDGLPVDLFLVRSPAQWGAVFAIRTGPGDFSKYLVTACKAMHLRCRDGALWRSDGSVLDTPEEEDFFKACGVPWVPPDERR